MFFFTNFKTTSFEKTKISDHYTVGPELIKREKSSESVQILRRNWNKLDDDHLVQLNCFLQNKFESLSGQLLTSDTNRCAEIVHERTKLSSYIDQISITPSTLHIVCGDLNVNFLKKSAKSTLMINQLEMNALALVDPQTATHETIRTKTCMDVFFTNFKTKSFVEETKIRDHYTVGPELVKREKSSESVQILRRNWNKLGDAHLLVELNCFLQKNLNQ